MERRALAGASIRENPSVEGYTSFCEFFVKPRRDSSALITSLYFTGGTDAVLFECEEFLRQDLVAFHAIDFNDRGHAATAIAEARLLHDDVDCRGDLLANGSHGKVHSRHEHHHLQAREQIARRVRVNRG